MASAARNTRIYDICDPYYGDKGPAFERVFKPAFFTGIAAKGDKFANLADHLRGVDPGGVKPSTSAQLTNNANHVNARNEHQGEETYRQARDALAAPDLTQPTRASLLSTKSHGESRMDESWAAFANRSSSCIASIRTHVENPGIRASIDALVRRHHLQNWGHADPAQRPPILGDVHGATRRKRPRSLPEVRELPRPPRLGHC